MSRLHATRAVPVAFVAVTAILLAFGAGRLIGSFVPALGPQVAVAQAEGEAAAGEAQSWQGPWASAVRVTAEGRELGKLMIGEAEAFTIQTSAGGLSPYERCSIVAMRINDALRAGIAPTAFSSGVVNGMAVVKADDRIIITIDQAQADLAGMTTPQLAAQWAQAIVAAFATASSAPQGEGQQQATAPPAGEGEQQGAQAGGEEQGAPPAETQGEQAAEQAAEWTPPEPYTSKFVPIISVLEGVKLGVARVNGPRSAVAQVQAVAQLETNFKDVLEVDVYIPISTKVPGKSLARVQGVAVTGLVDIKL